MTVGTRVIPPVVDRHQRDRVTAMHLLCHSVKLRYLVWLPFEFAAGRSAYVVIPTSREAPLTTPISRWESLTMGRTDLSAFKRSTSIMPLLHRRTHSILSSSRLAKVMRAKQESRKPGKNIPMSVKNVPVSDIKHTSTMSPKLRNDI